MTQREEYSIARAQRDAFKSYLTMCNHIEEVPRKDIILLIEGCTDVMKLRETRLIFESKIKKADESI